MKQVLQFSHNNKNYNVTFERMVSKYGDRQIKVTLQNGLTCTVNGLTDEFHFEYSNNKTRRMILPELEKALFQFIQTTPRI